MAETGYYDSPMTGEELDAAFAKMAGIDESVRQAAQSAETARLYGQTVEQNAQAIRDIEENLDVILEAPSQAQAASQSAERAAASEASAAGAAAQAGQSASAAAQSAEQAQQVAQGAQGWYETEEALRAAHPTGENGQWAIVGSTDTIWTWDSDTGAWVNTGSQMDLSGYYTKEQADSEFAPKSHAAAADTYGAATGSLYGHVKLSDTASSSDASGGVAATPKCVQTAVSSGANVQTLSVTPLASQVTVNSSTKCFKCANILVLFLSISVSGVLNGWTSLAKINGVSGVYDTYGKIATISTSSNPAQDVSILSDGTIRVYVSSSGYGNSYSGTMVTFCDP